MPRITISLDEAVRDALVELALAEERDPRSQAALIIKTVLEERMGRDLSMIGLALDEISRQWLSDTYPELAEAIEIETEQGASPEEIRRYVMRQTQRQELALRCEQAARSAALGAAGETAAGLLDGVEIPPFLRNRNDG